MKIFVVSFISLCILGFLCAHLRPSQIYKNIFLVVSALILFYLRAFIEPSSLPDLGPYKVIYDFLAKIPLLDIFTAEIPYDKMEPGFRLLMRLCSLFSLPYSGFLIVYGIIWIAAYFIVIRRHTDYVILAVLMLSVESYAQSLLVLRQHLAMVVFFLSFKYILNKNLAKYLLMVALAYSFHRTAIIAFPAYFLYNTKNKKTLIALICLTIATTLIVTSQISFFIKNSIFSQYSGYFTGSNGGTNSTLFFIELALTMAYIYILRGHVWEEGINRLLFVLILVGLILGFVGIGPFPTSRLAMYYTNLFFLAVPKMCEYAKTKWMTAVIIIIFLGMFTYKSFKEDNTRGMMRYQNTFIENVGL